MKRSAVRFFSFALILALVVSLFSQANQVWAAGSVSLTALGVAYTQDFNTLASTGTANTIVPTGWEFAESGANANTTYRAGTGSDNTGDTYSFGLTSSTERAFGGLRSGSLVPLIGAQFTNNTGSTIASLDVSYTGEQWRLGQNTSGRAADRLDFQFSTDATSITNGTWTDDNDLDFSSPVVAGTVGALNGNVSPNRTAVSATITGLSIPNGASFYLRWADSDLIPGSDDGLSVDDFSITPNGGIVTPNLSINDVSLNEGNSGTTAFTFTVSLSAPANAGGVTFDIATADGTAAAPGDYTAKSLTAQTIPAGSSTYSFSVLVNGDTTFEPNETFFVNVTNVTGADVQDSQGQGTITNDDVQPTAIHDIQGASHLSPLVGSTVLTVPAVVTALRTAGSTRGFYIQDVNPDSNDATSEGVFVFTGGSSTPDSIVSVGDLVQVSGKVSEFRQSGSTSTNLTLTELVGPLTVTRLSSGNPLPAPVVIGSGGRVPPNSVIEDDATGSAETSGVFDPANDGLDFYESLEGMLVQVNDAVATGPTSDFGSNREISVIGDNGANAGVRTPRGGVVIQPNDFNPERIILNDWISGGPTLPAVNVGDSFPGAILGVMDYSFGNFKLEVSSLPSLSSGGLTREVTTPAGTNQLLVATFNVENLAPSDPPSKFATLANLIVSNLQAPDILAIEEIQDNTGATDNGVVDASVTYGLLVSAIQAAGGPAYQYRQIDPLNDQDGGAPGGNIRQGFLFRTDRGLSFVDRPGATSTTANSVVGSGAATQLQYSPGRIDPTNSAFSTSRKPLAAEFMFNGHHLFAIANHFNSKSGDQPLFGVFQPPVRSSEVQRHQQAQVVHDFVSAITTANPSADVVVLGDLNDFQFSDTLSILKGGVLHTLMDTLPLNEQYSYDFEGNSQAIDHTLLSNDLFNNRPFNYDVVHVNSEFANQASDHEPQVTLVTLNDPPTVSAGGPYSVVEGSSVTVSATGSDLENGPLTYAWDLDNNGSFETSGQSVTFSAAGLEAPATLTIKVQVTDNGGLSAVASATVNVIYNWSGFFQPVDNLPTLNVVKAGSAIPVKFSLAGNQGLSIFVVNSPSSNAISCSTTSTQDDIEVTLTAGSSSLSYDAVTDQYTYVWKTDKAWANTCRQLVVKLADGTTHLANFKFSK